MAEGLNRAQVRAAMKAMMDKAMETPNEPIAMCIVDATGNLEAYAKMDNLRLFSRRHAQRKAYTLGDPLMTHGQGGLVIMKDGVILGGIGVGGYPSGQADEDISRIGLNAMNL